MSDHNIELIVLRLIDSKFKKDIETKSNYVLDQLDRQRSEIDYESIVETFISLIRYLESQEYRIKKKYKFKTYKVTSPGTIKKSNTIYKFKNTTIITKRKKYMQFKNLYNQFKYQYLIKVINEIKAIASLSFKIPRDRLTNIKHI
jgi:hypothetical protein